MEITFCNKKLNVFYFTRYTTNYFISHLSTIYNFISTECVLFSLYKLIICANNKIYGGGVK